MRDAARRVLPGGLASRGARSAAMYVIVLSLFLLLGGRDMIGRGMFCDGLVYTAIASNYSQPEARFWQPRFTATINGDPPPVRGVAAADQPEYTRTTGQVFYAHPPLMMYMLHGWMALAGAGPVAAKGYSIMVALLIAVLMVRLWRRLGFSRATGWAPLLLWTLIPPVTHYAFYNMLEPTMLVFILAAALCVMREGRAEWLWHTLGGVFLFLAFLTKEFPSLFPLALPTILWITGLRRHSFVRMVGLTLCMLGGLLVPAAVLWFGSAEAADFFRHYLRIQIMGQAMSDGAGNRAAIVGHFFLHSGIAMGVVLAVLLVHAIRTRGGWRPAAANVRPALAMTLLALCGVLPLMLSAKQSDYFLLSAFPFFAIGLAAMAEPWAEALVQRFRGGAAVAGVMAVGAAVLLAVSAGKPCRNVDIQSDMALLTPHLERGEVVSVPEAVFDEHFVLTLAGYYYIDKQVSLDSCLSHRHLLTTRTAGLGKFASQGNYRKLDTGTEQFDLYERTDAHNPTDI